jgi:hypothetical protein
MVHVFLLMLYIGVGDDRRLISNDMYFRNVNTCNYFAKELSKRYSTYAMVDNRDKATAYCLPKYVSEGSGIEIYD